MAGRTFYVDAISGNDSNDGASAVTAWRTVDHVNSQSFAPGDRILFHRGDVYQETLAPASSGASGNPIEFGAYGTGANPVFQGDGQSEVIDVSGVDYIRLNCLDVTHGKRGLLLENTTGSEVIDCNVYGNNRDGIYIGQGSTDTLVQGGSSHDNGEVDAKYSENQGRMINLGHGVLINTGAAGNTVADVDLYANAEDGVQFGNSAGDGNVLRDDRMYDNLEDGVDIKRGSHELIGNEIHGNTSNAVNIHNDSGVITLAGNDLSTVSVANALDVREGATVISSGNRYEGVNGSAVEITDGAGNHSTFTNDVIVDGGRESGVSIRVAAGSGHSFDDMTFVMRNGGKALKIEDGVDGVSVHNSDFYTDGTPMDAPASVNAAGNLFHAAAGAASAIASHVVGLPGDGASGSTEPAPQPAIAEPSPPPADGGGNIGKGGLADIGASLKDAFGDANPFGFKTGNGFDSLWDGGAMGPKADGAGMSGVPTGAPQPKDVGGAMDAGFGGNANPLGFKADDGFSSLWSGNAMELKTEAAGTADIPVGAPQPKDTIASAGPTAMESVAPVKAADFSAGPSAPGYDFASDPMAAKLGDLDHFHHGDYMFGP